VVCLPIKREMPSLSIFQRRAMEDIVDKSKARQEREEMEASLGLQQLGDGVVYTMVRGIPAPTATLAAARMPVMEEFPMRVSGMHPTALARETISQGLYTSTTEYILPSKFHLGWFQLSRQLVLFVRSRKGWTIA
jgi:hypothetical protein